MFGHLFSLGLDTVLICPNTTHSFGWILNPYKGAGNVQRLGYTTMLMKLHLCLSYLGMILDLSTTCSFAQLQRFRYLHLVSETCQRAVVLAACS